MWRTSNLVRSTVCTVALMLAVATEPLRAEPLLHHVHGLAYSSDGTALLVPSHFGLSAFRDVFEEAVHGRRSVIPVPSSVDARLLASFMSEEIQDRKVLQ